MSNGDPTVKTFAELKAEADKKWQGILIQKQLAITKRGEELALMPDVVGAPKVGDTYSMVGIVCPACGGTAFLVTHWTWINGNNHRWDGYCVKCQAHNCWDWGTMSWLPPEAISPTASVTQAQPVPAVAPMVAETPNA